MYVLILNSTNVQAGSNNTKFIYKFPSNITFEKGSQIAVSSINLYYSWFNINASLYNNNKFSYKWFNASGTLNVTVNVTIPDGNYTVATLNEYIQSVLVTNGHYIVQTSTGKFVYHIELLTNPTYYSVQLNVYTMITSTTATATGYTKPTTSWAFPTANTCPQVIIQSTNSFNHLIGFNAGTYPSVSSATSQTYLSTFTPTLSPVSSIIMTCSLCKQPLSIPDNMLFCFGSGNTSFGDMIDIQPSALSFVNIRDGSYNQLEVTLMDQNLTPMNIRDNQLIIMLTIRTLEFDSGYGN